jgi:TatD DNase family protein
MIFTDTHTHLYLDAFDEDREVVVQNAFDKGIEYTLLPNIDSASIAAMKKMVESFPNQCFPMIGLHPTSVKENFRQELEIVEKELKSGYPYIAIGEIGMDLYWDKTFIDEQVEALKFQIGLAKKHKLPIVIHQRDSFDEIVQVLESIDLKGIEGVFHCFTGTLEQAKRIIDLGFSLGIGGVLTFKKQPTWRCP